MEPLKRWQAVLDSRPTPVGNLLRTVKVRETLLDRYRQTRFLSASRSDRRHSDAAPTAGLRVNHPRFAPLPEVDFFENANAMFPSVFRTVGGRDGYVSYGAVLIRTTSAAG